MKRLILALALAASATLASCDEPRSEQVETAPPAELAPVAPAAEDVAGPAADAAAPTTSATDSTTVPPEQRTSEETVKPESETLFY